MPAPISSSPWTRPRARPREPWPCCRPTISRQSSRSPSGPRPSPRTPPAKRAYCFRCAFASVRSRGCSRRSSTSISTAAARSHQTRRCSRASGAAAPSPIVSPNFPAQAVPLPRLRAFPARCPISGTSPTPATLTSPAAKNCYRNSAPRSLPDVRWLLSPSPAWEARAKRSLRWSTLIGTRPTTTSSGGCARKTPPR